MNAGRQSFLVSAVMCLLMAALFVARYRLAPYPTEAPFEGGMPLASLLTRFTVAFPWLAALAATVIVTWTLVVVVQLTIKYAPTATRNYLPAQIFLVGAGGLVISGEALAALSTALLTALAARQFIFSLSKGYRFSEVFHAGFYLGFMPLLYAPAAVWALPVALAALTVYRRSVREAIVCLAGLALPVPAAGFIHWAAGEEGGFIYRALWRCATEHAPLDGLVPATAAAPAALLATLTLTAIVWAMANKKNVRKKQFKFMQQTSLALFFAAATVAAGSGTSLVAPLAVICSLCVPWAFQGKTAQAGTVLYFLAVATGVVLNLLPVLGIAVP